MPINQDNLNSQLARFLKRFKPTMRDTTGKVVPVPEEAEVFQFKFVVDGEDYGTVTISVDGLHKLVVYFNNEVSSSPKASENGDITWESLIRMIKDFAKGKQLSFELRNEDELEGDMAKRDHVKKLDESYHPMGKKASYNDAIPECKIIIKHSKVMAEGEQRFRNVERIFIENSQGERFLAPTTKPGIARVYARHIAEGGKPFDEKWQHIGAVVEDYTKMAGFVRATKGHQFNESTQKLVTEGINHYLSLRESLHSLTTRKGYHNYFESWTPPLMEDDIQEDLSDMFMSSTLDPRIESAMPILNKLSKHIAETKLDEIASLEEWADSVVEGSLIPKTTGQIENLNDVLSKESFALGPNGSFAKNALAPILHDDDLFNELEQAGKQDPNGDAHEIVLSWMNKQQNPEFQTILDKLQQVPERPDPTISETAYQDPEEADYDDDYQEMVKRVGKKAKEQEKKKQEDKVEEAGPAGKPGDYFDTEKVKTGPILGNKPQTQKGLRGKLVGESDALAAIKKLSGLK